MLQLIENDGPLAITDHNEMLLTKDINDIIIFKTKLAERLQVLKNKTLKLYKD